MFAVAWFVYKDLDASPAVFSLVGAAWTIPQVLLLMATGALSDRMDRRHLMIIGDLLRLLAIAAIGSLILLDAMTVPLLVALVLPYGAGQAIFGPAFSSIIPMIVPEEQLVEANSIGQTMRPLAMIVIGPIVGAAVVAVASTGWAFLLDALTFGVSAVCIAMMRVRAAPKADEEQTELWADVREGIAYVRLDAVAEMGPARRDGQPLLRLGSVGDPRAVRRHRPDVGHRVPAGARLRRRWRGVDHRLAVHGATRRAAAPGADRDVHRVRDRHGHDRRSSASSPTSRRRWWPR